MHPRKTVGIVSVFSGIGHQAPGPDRKYRLRDRAPAEVGDNPDAGTFEPVEDTLRSALAQNIPADGDDHPCRWSASTVPEQLRDEPGLADRDMRAADGDEIDLGAAPVEFAPGRREVPRTRGNTFGARGGREMGLGRVARDMKHRGPRHRAERGTEPLEIVRRRVQV